eukprot:4970308-Alexandrium_andersonii.AAC.1
MMFKMRVAFRPPAEIRSLKRMRKLIQALTERLRQLMCAGMCSSRSVGPTRALGSLYPFRWSKAAGSERQMLL